MVEMTEELYYQVRGLISTMRQLQSDGMIFRGIHPQHIRDVYDKLMKVKGK